MKPRLHYAKHASGVYEAMDALDQYLAKASVDEKLLHLVRLRAAHQPVRRGPTLRDAVAHQHQHRPGRQAHLRLPARLEPPAPIARRNTPWSRGTTAKKAKS